MACINCILIAYNFIILFKHLSKVAHQFIITIRIDCVRELKKVAPPIFKSASMVPKVITEKLYTNLE